MLTIPCASSNRKASWIDSADAVLVDQLGLAAGGHLDQATGHDVVGEPERHLSEVFQISRCCRATSTPLRGGGIPEPRDGASGRSGQRDPVGVGDGVPTERSRTADGVCPVVDTDYGSPLGVLAHESLNELREQAPFVWTPCHRVLDAQPLRAGPRALQQPDLFSNDILSPLRTHAKTRPLAQHLNGDEHRMCRPC